MCIVVKGYQSHMTLQPSSPCTLLSHGCVPQVCCNINFTPINYSPIVSGDANFSMSITGLTVGGFTQPTVARSFLQLPQAIEKGLVQRFLWIIPKPSFSPFSSLESANRNFSDYLGKFNQNDKSIYFIT